MSTSTALAVLDTCPKCGFAYPDHSVVDKLTDKQRKFVDNLVASPELPVAEIARRAGYGGENGDGARQRGHETLQRVTVQQALRIRKSEALDKASGLEKLARSCLKLEPRDLVEMSPAQRLQIGLAAKKLEHDIRPAGTEVEAKQTDFEAQHARQLRCAELGARYGIERFKRVSRVVARIYASSVRGFTQGYTTLLDPNM